MRARLAAGKILEPVTGNLICRREERRKKMNDLRKTTITTLEIADMMEVSHADILKKLEGRKDRKGYIQIISEGQMSVADYFVKSVYIDVQGKERPCYEVTKLGCDFLANKFTGEKGVLFTARYVKRFHEMENQAKQVPVTDNPGKVANLINVLARRMDNQGSEPYKSAEMAQLICTQYGIQLPADFVKVPEHTQIKLEFSDSKAQ